MNSLIFIGLILVAITGCQARYTNAQQKKIQKAFQECDEDFGIPDSRHYFERGFTGALQVQDPKATAVIFCVILRLGFSDCDGTMDKQAVVEFHADGHDVSSLPGVVDQCVKTRTGNTAAEKAFSFYRCFFDQKKFVA